MPKADSSCTRITRRTAIATVVGGITQPAHPALARLASSDPIFAAIAAHRAAYRRFGSAVDISASLHPSDPRNQEAEDVTSAASEALESAATELTTILPASFAGVLALLSYVDDFSHGEPDESEYFLWPDELTNDDLFDADGRQLTMPFQFWIMRNIYITLQKLGRAG